MIAHRSHFRKKKNLFYRKLFLALLVFGFLIIFLVFCKLNLEIIQRERLAKREMDFLKEQKQQLELDKKKFSEKILEAGTITYLEKMARGEFNLQEEGETTVALPISDDIKEETSSISNEEKIENIIEKESFWQKLQKFLKKIGFKKRD